VYPDLPGNEHEQEWRIYLNHKLISERHNFQSRTHSVQTVSEFCNNRTTNILPRTAQFLSTAHFG